MKVEAKGIEGVQEFLKDLADKEGKKIVRKGTKDALVPVLEKMASLVPVKTGALKKSLKIKAGGGKKGKGKISAQVRTDAKDFFKGDQFYGGMNNFGWDQVPTYRIGTKIYSTKRGTQPTTHREGKHWAENALDAAASEAVEAFAASIKKQVTKLRAKKK